MTYSPAVVRVASLGTGTRTTDTLYDMDKGSIPRPTSPHHT
jgi:hypothetical protein